MGGRSIRHSFSSRLGRTQLRVATEVTDEHHFVDASPRRWAAKKRSDSDRPFPSRRNPTHRRIAHRPHPSGPKATPAGPKIAAPVGVSMPRSPRSRRPRSTACPKGAGTRHRKRQIQGRGPRVDPIPQLPQHVPRVVIENRPQVLGRAIEGPQQLLGSLDHCLQRNPQATVSPVYDVEPGHGSQQPMA